MCGRYQLSHDPRPTLGRLGVNTNRITGYVQDRYNIAPSQPVLVVREDNGMVLEEMTWQWPPAKPGRRPLINAKAETAGEKRTWKEALQSRRCLLPATGFYEWRKGDRQPYLIRRFPLDEPMLLAGMWQEFEDGARVVILTTEANGLVAQIHDPREDNPRAVQPRPTGGPELR